MSLGAIKEFIAPAYSPELIEQKAKILREEITNSWTLFQEALKKGHKDYVRELHIVAKSSAPEVHVAGLLRVLEKHKKFFKLGSQIEPSKIQPRLVLVERGSIWEDIFKICRASWSMPYSRGYGRRLRFVAFDEYHEAVMGIIGLQSPPADLACRDQLFEFPEGQKLDYINCMLDAYTIGAIPPYSNLLGGKLIASLVVSEDVRKAYWRLYAGKKTILEKKLLLQPLLAVTTTSAFGRSSIYNRLRIDGKLIAEPIGWTKGYGTIHLESVYPKIVEWLRMRGELIPDGFGHGPRVRWQNISTAISRLGLPNKYTAHGLMREVFLFRHVDNLEEACAGRSIAQPIIRTTDALCNHWKFRWALPRSERDSAWREANPLILLREAIQQLTIG